MQLFLPAAGMLNKQACMASVSSGMLIFFILSLKSFSFFLDENKPRAKPIV